MPGNSTNNIWKVVRGFNYEVNTLGDVRNYKTKRVLKPQLNSRGYYFVQLYKGGKIHSRLVHRLVARAFVNNPHKCKTVNHINLDKQNNCHTNLEWRTLKGNLKHRHAKHRYLTSNYEHAENSGTDKVKHLSSGDLSDLQRLIELNTYSDVLLCEMFEISVFHLQAVKDNNYHKLAGNQHVIDHMLKTLESDENS